MLPNSVGVTSSTSSSTVCCVRCSKHALSRESSRLATVCANGHITCFDCDISMHHQCKRCGIPTTSVLQPDEAKSIDPKTLPAEELTQLELNSALQQFKLNFKKFSHKGKRSRLVETTSHIIEILNPSLIMPYKKGGRCNQSQIEEHFYRTSEKSQHTFAWHKAALEFVMDRTIVMKKPTAECIDDSILSTTHEMQPNIEIDLCTQDFQNTTNKGFNFLRKYTQQRKFGKTTRKQKKELLSNFTENSVQALSTLRTVEKVSSEHKTIQELIDREPLINVNPNEWLTEACCPHCELYVRFSDFSKHFAIYHCLPIICMDVGESRCIQLDSQILLNRGSYPHTLFLIKNVVRDLGGSEYRNLFPIVLITAAYRQCELFDDTKLSVTGPKHLMIWLSSISLKDEFNVCLKIISEHIGKLGHCSTLNKLYPITSPQNLREIYESGNTLLLPSETHSALSRNGIQKILLEISLHESNQSSA